MSKALFGIGLLVSVSAHALVLDVPSTPYPTIAAALSAAVAGDEVRLLQAGSPFTETGLTVPSGVHVYGEGAGWSVVLDGQGADDLFFIVEDASDVSFSNLTLQNGNSQDGGAIYISNSIVTIDQIMATGNHADNMGGVVYMTNSSLTVTGSCFISQNSTGHYGGAIAGLNSKLYIHGGIFTENTTLTNSVDSGGGAIWLYTTDGENHSEGEFYGVSFDGNEGYYAGGAVGAILANLTFTQHCQLSNNKVRTVLTNNGYVGYGAAILCNDDIPVSHPEYGYFGAFVRLEDNTSFHNNRFIGSGGNGGAAWTFEAALSISDCNFSGNGINGQSFANYGGAILFGGYDGGAALYDLSINRSKFDGNGANHGGAIVLWSMLSGGIFTAPIVRDSEFTNNSAAYGGAIYTLYADSDIQNCRIISNTATVRGGAIYCKDFLSAKIDKSIIVDNFAPNGSAIGAEMQYYVDNDVQVSNCNIVNNGGGSPTFCSGGAGFNAEYTNMHNNGVTHLDNWTGCLAGQGPDVNGYSVVGNIEKVPAFINPDGAFAERDYRLRWDSQLMDAGDPAFQVDFDLTRTDIGWTEPVEERTLTVQDVIGGTLFRGHYNVTEPMSLTIGAIEEGSVVRVAAGQSLVLQPSGTTTLNPIAVGDMTKARTALVGRVASGTPCTSITIGKTATGTTRGNVALNGVLLNYTPANGFRFARSNVNMLGSQMLIRNSLSGGLYFDRCQGEVNGFVFTFEEQSGRGLGNISELSSSVSIRHNEFGPVQPGMDWAVKIYGGIAGITTYLEDNDFIGTTAAKYPVNLVKSEVHIRKNRFETLVTGAIRQLDATSHMYKGAKNYFDLESNASGSIVKIEGGEADLYCGYNDLLRPAGMTITHKFVESTPVLTPLPIYRDWTHNYWGYDTQNTYSEQDVEDPDGNGPLVGKIPPFVQVDGMLTVFDQLYVPCGSGNNLIPSELFAAGTAAEEAMIWDDAEDAYATLLQQYPEAKEANASVVRLKALGLEPAIGELLSDEIILDLELSAEAANGVDTHLAVFERCSRQVLLGVYVDQDAAKSELTNMLAATTDPTDLKCIDLALLELETVAPAGGLSATSASPVDRVLVHQTAVDRLLNYTGPEQASTDEPMMVLVPSEFKIQSCYPNPFNPVTTIALAIPVTGVYLVRLFNILGQQVQVLQQGSLQPGEHRIQLHGEALSSGMYIVQAEGPQGVRQEKVMLLK